jgi:hypothetical protein
MSNLYIQRVLFTPDNDLMKYFSAAVFCFCYASVAVKSGLNSSGRIEIHLISSGNRTFQPVNFKKEINI